MKNYTITVNGVAYDVTVEEKTGVNNAPMMSAPIPQKAPVAMSTPANNANKGGIAVTAGAAGKVLKINVKPGDKVNAGDTIAILEVMKMETAVVTSDAGVIASIETKEGAMIEAGAPIVTLNQEEVHGKHW